MAVGPLENPNKAAEEIRGAVGEHGFQGACIPTSAAGRPLDLPAFASVWDTLAELGLLVFMHATTAITRESLGQYTLNTVIAWPTEVTIAAVRLIFSGVVERHPGPRLALSHGGGALPYLAGRLDLAYQAPKHERSEERR